MSRKQRLLIGITSRLRLWHKVLFGCAVLIVPTAVLLYYFTTAANDAIRFAAKERCGVAYLQVLREMIGRTQSPGAGIGDLLTRLDAVESQTCLSGSYREELQAGDLSDLVRRDWRTYDAQPRQQPDPRSQSRLYALFAQVGDMSNLILDPDLDTYYMMDLILLRFPESMQMLTRVAATHEGALTEYAAINRHIGNVEHSLRVAVDNNDYYPGSRGTLYSAIDRSRDTYLAAMRQVLASLDGQISPEDRLAATNAARAALLNLYDQGAIWLDRALQARIAEKIRWKYQTYAIFGSLLVFAFGFAYLTANNIVGRLMELVAVSRRIAGGDMTQRIQVSSRDEIGQLAESFNLMTDRVEKWTTEMTAANEALRAEVAERERLEQEAGRRTQELETKNEEQRRREKVMISLLNDLRAAEIKLKQVAAKLESSNKELEQFAYVASHDLQAPLRGVSGFADLLKQRYGDKLGQEGGEFIEFIVQGSNQMHHMIGDVLQLSRVSTRGGEMLSVDTRALLDKVRGVIRADLESIAASVEYGSLPTVKGDASQLQQLFQNLIGNAIKFQKKGTAAQVRVTASPLPESWHFQVADNGIGIPANKLDGIFTIFTRLHTADEYAGTGIGLAICKKIVERHGGRIWVESEPGKGSTFHFTLMTAN